MPRPERPVDPDAGPVQSFAADLRSLREGAGRPTYEALARRAGVSRSSLSEAAGGEKFPTLETTLAYVRGCGGDEQHWARRWRETNRLLAERTAHLRPEPQVPTGAGVRRRPRRWLWAAGLGVAAALMAAGAAIAMTLPDRHRPDQPDRPAAATRQVRDGADPKDSECAADPAVATVDSREINVDGVAVGVVELRYSPRCGVSWGRFTPTGQPPALTKPGPVYVHVTAMREADGQADRFSMRYTGTQVFGNVLNSTRECVRAEVYFSGDGWQSLPARTACYRGMTGIRR